MNARPNSEEIIAASEQLLAQAQQLIDQADAKLRSDGLDSNDLARLLGSHASAKAVEAGRAAFEADMEAIEREVEAERVRLAFFNPQTNAANKPATSAPRKPRNMI